MNILVMSWRDPKHPLAGGAEQVDHEHHKGWIAAGNKVTLFSSSFTNAKKIEEIDGVKIIRKGNQILGVQLQALFWYLFERKEKFDLVVDEFHGIPFFTPLYIWGPKMAVLQEVARDVWLKNDLHYPLNVIVGNIGYYFEPLVYLLYRQIIFMVGSQSAKKELHEMKISNENIKVVPHGVILDLPKNKLEKEKIKTVIFLGALAKDKGIEDAIKTFAILNKKSDYQFWIVGKGGEDYLSYLKGLCKKLAIENKVIFWGFVSQKKKFELLTRAHIMLNPSLLEGFGLVNIEANACATPVVAYNCPGLVDSVENNQSGKIIEKNIPAEMAKEIDGILKNKNEYKKLQNGALEWSQRFSWEASRKLSLDLVESLGIK
ncbi:MAG TPA: glycosyltransferase family 4 protein [Patescibacteria group bacterium]|nr:glycosyltransferase family 4 protein [Patescibacteria group bacterium]